MREADRRSMANHQAIVELQRQTNDDVLCPLYELFLFSYSPKGIAAQEDPVRYETSFRVIEQGARTLKCTIQTRTIR